MIQYLQFYIGLIRGHDEAERHFIASNGFSYLLRALQRNIPKLNVKTIFLISYLTEEKQEYVGNVAIDVSRVFFKLYEEFAYMRWEGCANLVRKNILSIDQFICPSPRSF